MRKLACLSALLLSACNLETYILMDEYGPVDVFPIKGGWEAEAADWPFYAGLAKGDFRFCGSVLVASDVILTAAHCVEEKPQGVHALFESADSVAVERWLIHPNYDPNDWGVYDYALGYLSDSAPPGAQTALINVDPDYPEPRQQLYAAGYGVTDSGYASNVLLETYLGEVPRERCENYYPPAYLNDDQICAGYRGHSICSGDSGGPLVDADGVLVGITSWGASSCEEAPMVFMRVSSAFEWILRHIRD